jgi:HSP20 family molecular chaperone IbpA
VLLGFYFENLAFSLFSDFGTLLASYKFKQFFFEKFISMAYNEQYLKLWIGGALLIVIFCAGAIVLDVKAPWQNKRVGQRAEKPGGAVASEKGASSKIILVEPAEDIDFLERQISSLFDGYVSSHFQKKNQPFNSAFSDDDVDVDIAMMKKMREEFLADFMQFRREMNEVFDDFARTHKPLSLTARIAGDWSKASPMRPVHIYEDNSNYLYKIEAAGLEPEKVSITVEGRLMKIVFNDDKKKVLRQEQVSSINQSERQQALSNIELKVLLPENADFMNTSATMEHSNLVITVPKQTLVNHLAIKVPIQ